MTAYATYFSETPTADVLDLAWTLQKRRALLPYRISITANSVSDLATKILTKLQQDGTSLGIKALSVPKQGASHGILGVFTGQGAQYTRMGAELVEQSPMARAM